MTKRNDQTGRLQQPVRDALAWIVRLKSGEATQKDVDQLMAWRAESPAHEQAYREAVKCWHVIGLALINDPPLAFGDKPGRTKSKSHL